MKRNENVHFGVVVFAKTVQKNSIIKFQKYSNDLIKKINNIPVADDKTGKELFQLNNFKTKNRTLSFFYCIKLSFHKIKALRETAVVFLRTQA